MLYFLFTQPCEKSIFLYQEILRDAQNINGSDSLINMNIVLDLKKRVVKKHGEQSDIILPLECHFLNKNAFISVVGHQPQVINV